MRKLQLASLVVLALSVMLWTAGRIWFVPPDWAVRVNGAVILIAMAALVFASVRVDRNF